VLRSYTFTGISDTFSGSLYGTSYYCDSIPTSASTGIPTKTPTSAPSATPANASTNSPTYAPTPTPTDTPTYTSTPTQTYVPTHTPSTIPTHSPSHVPTSTLTNTPTPSYKGESPGVLGNDYSVLYPYRCSCMCFHGDTHMCCETSPFLGV